MAPKVREGVAAGTMPLSEAFAAKEVPHGMTKTSFHDGTSAFIHEGIGRQLDEWKALGNDAVKIEGVMPVVGAVYKTYLQAWRKAATTHGPQFAAYSIRNAVGDAIRMAQGNMLSLEAVGDIKNLLFPMQEYIKTGKLNAFADRVVNLGEAGARLFPEHPDGIIPATKFMEMALDHQVAAGGQIRADIFKGAENAYKQSGNKLARGWEYATSLMSAREDVQRVAGFAERLRRGDGTMAAAFNVENALFNMRRLSKAAQFSRDWGLTPFTWSFKNIPFQFQFMLENPGIFSAIMRGQEMLQNGDMAESQYPEWMKNKFNYVFDTHRAANGHLMYTIATDTGMNPVNDFRELMNSAKQGPGGLSRWLAQNAGPVLQAMNNVQEYARQSETQQGNGPDLSPLIGRPKQSWSKLVDLFENARDKQGEQRGRVIRLLEMAVLPVVTHEVDVTQQGAISNGQAKSEVKRYQAALRHAQAAYDLALDQARADQSDLNAAMLTGNEMQFSGLQSRIQSSQAILERAKRVRERISNESNRSRERAESLIRTN
jgi:hypothetical protein